MSAGEASVIGGWPRPRRAVPADSAELVRLRALMFAAMGTPTDKVADPVWQGECAALLQGWLGRPDSSVVAYVVEAPEAGLAASAVAEVTWRMPSPLRRDPRVAHVGSVCTDPRWRRRGLARAALGALLADLDATGVPRADLHATGDADRLYRSLGFVDVRWPSLRREL